MSLKGGSLLLAAMVLASCSQSKKGSNERSNGAIVHLNENDGDENTLQKTFPNNKVRAISLEDNLFQIEGAKVDEVQSLLPHSQIQNDRIVNYLKPEFNKRSKADAVRDLTKRENVMEKFTNLGCHREGVTPTAVVDLKSETTFVGPLVVKMNSAPVVITAENSVPGLAIEGPNTEWEPSLLDDPLANTFWGSNQASNLEHHWIVDVPPGGSTPKNVDAADLTITPDQYGGHTAILIVQDKETLACDLTAVVIGVSTNDAYAGKQNTPAKEIDQDVYFHLSTVGAQKAWETTKGEGTVVAVIDSGVNYNHPELADSIYVNPNEVAGNGLDDDKNGLVDDVNGYDFAFNDNRPFDDESHGTHVSGIVAGRNIGVAPGTKILPIKALFPTGSANDASILAAIYYAIKMKVDVINMSLGGEGEPSPFALLALKRAQEAGILVVVAAGNTSDDLDVVPSYFTSKDGTNVLAIAASDENGALADYSCFGLTTVDVAAPGGTQAVPITSASTWVKEMDTVGHSGTSMASPVAAGVAALGKSLNKSLNAEELKALMLSTGVDSDTLIGKLTTAKVVNGASLVQSLAPRTLASVTP